MEPGKILVAQHEGVHLLKFEGDVRVTLSSTLDAFVTKLFEQPEFESIIIDLTETDGVDSTSLGLLVKLALRAKQAYGIVPTIVTTRPDITRILDTMSFEKVFNVVHEPLQSVGQLGELKICAGCEVNMRRHMIEAHRLLVDLSEHNRKAFIDLLDLLEAS